MSVVRQQAIHYVSAIWFSTVAGDAFAQAPPEPSSGLEEIVVTAQRRAESVQDTPLAISAFRGDSLAERGVADITQVQSLVPNVNIQQRTSFGVVTVRGVGFDILTAGAETGVAMHLDGVYVGRPAAGLTGFYDVERLEVARGPQGTLYGRNSTGGTVNIITRKPTSEPEGYVTLTAGSYEQAGVEGAVSGPIGERVAWRLSGKVDERGGYGENKFNGKDIDDLSSRAARGQLLFEFSDDVSLALSGDYFEQDDSAFVFHYGGPVAGCRPPGIPGTIAPPATSYLPTCGVLAGGAAAADIRDVNNDFHPRNEREFYGASATLDWNLHWAALRSISAYRAGTSDFASDLDGTSANLFFITREEDQEQYSQELQLSGDSQRLQWVVGLYFFHEENLAAARGGFGPQTGRTLLFQVGDLETQAYAAFGQLTYRLTENFAVTLGARYSEEEKSIAHEAAFAGAGAPALRPATLPDEISFDAFTPKVGIEYRPADAVLLFATAQQGFKSGGFSLGSLAAPYLPEEIWSYEVGMKSELWQGVRVNVTGFHYDYTDMQQGRVEGFASVIRNAATATINGAELEIMAELTPSVTADLSAAWLEATFDDYVTADPARAALGPLDLEGHRLANAPDYTVSAGLQKRWDAFDGEVTLRGEVYCAGKAYFSPFNLEPDSQDAYETGNVIVSYDNPSGWYGSLYVRNVTDETVSAGGFVSSALVGGISSRSLLPPRTVALRVGRRF